MTEARLNPQCATASHPLGVRFQIVAAGILLLLAGGTARAQQLRLGIIGTDSTHAVEFTRILNDPKAADHVQGARIVAAYRGGSPNVPLSRDRIQQISAQIETQWKIPFVDRIPDLCDRIDGLLLLSVDPARRPTEFEAAASCGKPIFVDKPLAPTLQAATAMVEFAQAHHVRWFSSSALRFNVPAGMRGNAVYGAEAWGPGTLGEGYALDLSWYGIHSIELLFAAMGSGVRSVSRVHTPTADTLTGVWNDGRVGIVHLVRPDARFAVAELDAQGHTMQPSSVVPDYAPLLRAIVAFVRSGQSPVAPCETLEVFAFMDAAQRSMESGGANETIAERGCPAVAFRAPDRLTPASGVKH